MNMHMFSQIFAPLSFMGGAMIGLIAGAGFALLLAKRRYRNLPPEITRQFFSVLYGITVPLTAGFLVFRFLFGREEFNLLATARSFVLELVLYRLEWLLAGIIFGLAIILIVFLYSTKSLPAETKHRILRGGAWGKSAH